MGIETVKPPAPRNVISASAYIDAMSDIYVQKGPSTEDGTTQDQLNALAELKVLLSSYDEDDFLNRFNAIVERINIPDSNLYVSENTITLATCHLTVLRSTTPKLADQIRVADQIKAVVPISH